MKVNKNKGLSSEEEEPYHQLFEAVASVKNSDEAKCFLEDLCTPAELQAMTDRWRVVEPIKAGQPYRQIHDKTGVSVTTIGRVARYITQGQGGYNLIFSRLKKKKNVTKRTPKNSNTKKGKAE
jgi:TrpR-related protein YerC/YecD